MRKIPAVFMRGGTSKGLFFRGEDLPDSQTERDKLFLAAMGSPDSFGRQLNGMGGGLSSLSKIAVVEPSRHPDCDVDFTFGQVLVNKPVVEYGANCGNLSSAVGPFAVDDGLVTVADGSTCVRIFNTNTRKIIHARFAVENGMGESCGRFRHTRRRQQWSENLAGFSRSGRRSLQGVAADGQLHGHSDVCRWQCD